MPAPPADATEVIATALRAKVSKSGYRHIAVDLNRPPCTVRRWLRAARPTHLTWLRQQGVQALAAIDLDLPNTIDLTPTDHGPTALQPLRQALNVLATAALAIRRRLPALATDIWTLIGAIARGQLIPAARPG
ncbi:hypothetical protein LWF15_12725 [Kineosporia rhizophila]|uniref:hypothetical protein n=1 Tax=Kineosporia rhizophila TaxID=84633 RepID=UPI000A524174|nr:hypothetical protein [Kineosporia rhizophila]MCE0536375.1 hypothetical protein [Kineosporia rhizophila]